jgi:hypothetical protein
MSNEYGDGPREIDSEDLDKLAELIEKSSQDTIGLLISGPTLAALLREWAGMRRLSESLRGVE